MNNHEYDAFYVNRKFILPSADGNPVANQRFILERADGTTITGMTDANGDTGDITLEKLNLRFVKDDK